MWPTSMPRTISSVPLPSGVGSPSTTLRRSATTRLGQVAAPVHAGVVQVVFVGADSTKSAHGGDRAVRDDAAPASSCRCGPESSRRPRRTPAHGSRASVAKRKPASGPRQLADLDLVELVIAAQAAAARSSRRRPCLRSTIDLHRASRAARSGTWPRLRTWPSRPASESSSALRSARRAARRGQRLRRVSMLAA